MRSLSWNLFAVTGWIDAYLLYKDLKELEEPQRKKEERRIESRASNVGPYRRDCNSDP